MIPSSTALLNVCSNCAFGSEDGEYETLRFHPDNQRLFTTPCACWGRKGPQLVPCRALAPAHRRNRWSSGEIFDSPRRCRGTDHDQKSHVSLPNTRARTL